MALGTALLGRHDAAGVIDQSIDAIKAFAQGVSEFSHGIEVIKITDKRDAVHHPSYFSGALRVSPHHGHPPGPSRQFAGDFSANSTTSAGNDCGSVHGTLSLVSPAYGLGIT
jgi:hypothetical protein